MKAILASLATVLVLIASGQAGVSFLAPQYQVDQAKLSPSCGSERAYVIAALHEDVDIHKTWADLVTDDPSKAAVAGDIHWHRNWIQVYTRAIALLQYDCTS